jgi:hypothetical protein
VARGQAKIFRLIQSSSSQLPYLSPQTFKTRKPEGLPLFPSFLASYLPSFPLLLHFNKDFKEPEKTGPVFNAHP